MKKRIISIFTLLFTILLFTGCSNAVEIPKENMETMHEIAYNLANGTRGYTIPDGYEVTQGSSSDTITISFKPSDDSNYTYSAVYYLGEDDIEIENITILPDFSLYLLIGMLIGMVFVVFIWKIACL